MRSRSSHLLQLHALPRISEFAGDPAVEFLSHIDPLRAQSPFARNQVDALVAKSLSTLPDRVRSEGEAKARPVPRGFPKRAPDAQVKGHVEHAGDRHAAVWTNERA